MSIGNGNLLVVEKGFLLSAARSFTTGCHRQKERFEIHSNRRKINSLPCLLATPFVLPNDDADKRVDRLGR